mmetsp:Transcript_131768/g.367322  ORF Transcript_131768/g.367322 Transcript_131768/m.367322 type:complete len:85 (-) Transcript_131768:20-274(-)
MLAHLPHAPREALVESEHQEEARAFLGLGSVSVGSALSFSEEDTLRMLFSEDNLRTPMSGCTTPTGAIRKRALQGAKRWPSAGQ